MGNVYSLDAERNLILYRAGTNLYIRSTSGENLARPVTLCTDYEDSLSDTTYNGTIYYAYRNIKQDIIVRSITDLQNIYKINSQEIPDCHDPRLINFRDDLILFYTIKSPLNSASYLKAVFPLKPEKRIKLPETAFPEILNFGILVMSDRLVLCAASPEKQVLFSINTTFEPIIYPPDSPELETRLDTASAQLHDTQQKLDTTSKTLLETQQKLDITSKTLCDTQQKLDTVSAQLHETQQRFDITSEELTRTKNSLKDAQLLTEELQTKNTCMQADLHAQTQAHNETIENIRAQYNELMNTATRYREEAVRWHDIAYKKDTKPIPGESLIADNW